MEDNHETTLAFGKAALQGAEEPTVVFERLLTEAKGGSAAAQREVGVCYLAGRGVAPDAGEAVAWFRQAADQGDAEAQYQLGLAYLDGTGVKRDPNAALDAFGCALKQGHEAARQRAFQVSKVVGKQILVDTGEIAYGAMTSLVRKVTGQRAWSADAEMLAQVHGNPTPCDLLALLSSMEDAQIGELAQACGLAQDAERDAIHSALLLTLRSAAFNHLDSPEPRNVDQRMIVLWCRHAAKTVEDLATSPQLDAARKARVLELARAFGEVAKATPDEATWMDRLPTLAVRMLAAIYASFDPKEQAAFQRALVEDVGLDPGASVFEDIESLIFGYGVTGPMRKHVSQAVQRRVTGTFSLLTHATATGAAIAIGQRVVLGSLGPVGLLLSGGAAMASFIRGRNERLEVETFLTVFTALMANAYYNRLDRYYGEVCKGA